MKKHPLFKVLVLGGASLVTTAPFLWTGGCGGDSDTTPGTDWPPREGPGRGGGGGELKPDSGGDADAHSSDAAGDADVDASESDASSDGDADSGDG